MALQPPIDYGVGVPSVRNPLEMIAEGLALRQKQQEEAAKLALSQGIGQRISAGDYQGAAGAAFGAGDISSGIKINELSLNDKKQFAETVTRYVSLATPESWPGLRRRLTDITGEDPGEDLETARADILADYGDLDNILAENERTTDNAREDERLRLEQERVRIAGEEKGSQEPPRFREVPGGRQEPVPGGAADPETIRLQSEARTGGHQPRPLAQTAINALTGAGSSYADLDRVMTTFDDKYGGFISSTAGDMANWAGRNMPGATEERVAAAEWWQDYQRQKNVTRHELFGSALTRTELPQFEAADINPGMKSETIRANLERQRTIAQRAARKLANVYIQQGYKPEVIEAAIGMPLADIGLTDDLIAAPADATAAGSADENSPPQAFLDAGGDEEDWRFVEDKDAWR